ncbi:MAG: adenylosuccinate synthase [Anaerolineae bacterium]|nr:adenylosuccinate synthase [Anaerolineae bacterium]
MPVTILVGTQWGDEGKGKVTDVLADEAQLIARYNGGDNAGHTLAVQEQTYKLHFIPSGILRPGVMSLMGGGMVIHPERLLNEMESLRRQGIEVTPQRLKLATNAHIITPAHQLLEQAQEKARGRAKLDTTGRGIGPAYASKIAREGIRAAAMRDPDAFGTAIYQAIAQTNRVLNLIYQDEPLDADAVARYYHNVASELAPYLVDSWALVHAMLREGGHVLAEGGQATLLDVDHGNYPYVTSSNPVAGGALVGLGFGPRVVDRVIGVAKAFCTRVGAGPFPTQVEGEMAERMRGDGSQAWDDFGTTTGRPRRMGWLDLVALRYAVAVNGLTELALTKLDVLSRFADIPVAVAYEIDGERTDAYPVDMARFARATPIYETLPGWEVDIMGVTRYADLPAAARRYVEWIEAQLEVPLTLVSVGPGREQTLLRG